ncbi:MAG: hypothetical protein M0Q38_00040 [Bacteroidales bacterium]|jgi:hypothetical protein|nr:hypothetical protein [Bacteroidales bacterium]
MDNIDWPSPEELHKNYINLKEKLTHAIGLLEKTADLREAKGYLIEVQNHFKGLKLYREDREELYKKLQDAFDDINERIEQERKALTLEANRNFEILKEHLEGTIEKALNSSDNRSSRELLREEQTSWRNSKLLREHRDVLYSQIQDAYTLLTIRQEEEQEMFEKEAQKNYHHLKTLVDKALSQAEETHEYKETREFLKKIQSEFKGVKMIREQREELYARLQTAFDILNKRLDEFFRTKKKNWEVKMQYKLSESSSEIFLLRENINKEYLYIKELEDQLDIITSAGKDKEVILGLESRIFSAQTNIKRKENQIAELELEMKELKTRLDPEEAK